MLSLGGKTFVLLVLALILTALNFVFNKTEWGYSRGYVTLKGEIISTNYNRVILLDKNSKLWSLRLRRNQRIYVSDGVEIFGYAKGGKIYVKKLQIERNFLQKFRIKIHNFLKGRFLKTAKGKFAKKLGSALIFGENWFSKKERLKISHLGIYHIIVISGMHFALFLTFFFIFPLRWKLRWKLALLFFSVFTLFILFPKAPAYRAFISVAIFLLASILERPYNALKALLIAYSISIAIYPFWMFNYGFWLSYLATLSLILYYGVRKTPEQDYFGNFLGKTLGLEASVVVMATINPILVYYLKYISFGVFLYGFIFTFVAEIYIFVAVANLITLWSIPPLTELQNWIASAFEFFYRVLPDKVYLTVSKPPTWEMYLFVVIAIFICFLPLKRSLKWFLLFGFLIIQYLVFL